jgi:hypothetical protein
LEDLKVMVLGGFANVTVVNKKRLEHLIWCKARLTLVGVNIKNE